MSDLGARASRPIVYLHTGSHEKQRQYAYLFAELGLDMRPALVPDKREPQIEGFGVEAEKILVTRPLDDAAALVEREGLYPFVVEDTMLFIEHFNSDYAGEKILPGADTKRWWRALGAGGVLKLMGDTSKRRGQYLCQIGVLLGPDDRRFFRAEVDDTFLRHDYRRRCLAGAAAPIQAAARRRVGPPVIGNR